MAATDTETPVDTAEQAAFREKVRRFLSEHCRRRGESSDDDGMLGMEGPTVERGPAETVEGKKYQAALYDAGLAGITMPTEFGGQGLAKRFQEIFNEEAADYVLPNGVFTIGHGMCYPTILEHGTPEQKQRYLKPLLRGDEVWCQLFSEPGAGSDVASLQTRAVRDGEEYLVNGQKVWTSGAHYSDYGILIARTDPDQPKHRGISMLILDMHSPGVEVRALKQITGGANFNEVYFTDVRVPASNLVGTYNEGWRAAISMLMNERVAIGASGGPPRLGGIGALLRLARAKGLSNDGVVRQGLIDIYIRQRIMSFMGMRTRAALKAGKAPGPEGSLGKLAGALLARAQSDLSIAIAGASGQAWESNDPKASRWALGVLTAPASAIAGGTNEVQRNIIGERVLGLPKDVRVDEDVPFRELKVGTQRS